MKRVIFSIAVFAAVTVAIPSAAQAATTHKCGSRSYDEGSAWTYGTFPWGWTCTTPQNAQVGTVRCEQIPGPRGRVVRWVGR